MTTHDERQHVSSYTGFTLIELLVVLAIVSILAAILSPVMAQTRNRAHQTSCLSNLKQTGIAILLYAQDNDETFPNGVNQNGMIRVWPGEGWAGQCFTYLKTPAIFRCPADLTTALSPNDYPVSFAMNNNVVGYADLDDAIPSGLTFSRLQASSRTVLLFEVSGVKANIVDPREGADDDTSGSNFSAAGNGLDNRLYAQKDWSTRVENQYATGYLGKRPPFDLNATQFSSPNGRHATGANYCLADGHARFLPGSRVSSGRNALNPDCFQDNLPQQPNCDSSFRAAGTSSSQFPITFSVD